VTCPPGTPSGNISVANVSARPDAQGARKSYIEITTVAGFVRVSKGPSEPAEKFAFPPPGQKGPPFANFTVTIANLENATARSAINISITNDSGQQGWSAYPDGNFSLEVAHGRPVTFDFSVWPPEGLGIWLNATYDITATFASNSSRTDSLHLTVTMGQIYRLNTSSDVSELTVARGQNATAEIVLNNTGNGPDVIEHTSQVSSGLLVSLPAEMVALESHCATSFNITIYAAADAVPGLLSVQVTFYSRDYPSTAATVAIRVNLI
jgi:uncharacterized membrane protein